MSDDSAYRFELDDTFEWIVLERPGQREQMEVVISLMRDVLSLFGVEEFWWEVDQDGRITWRASYPNGIDIAWTVDRPFGGTFQETVPWARQFTYRWALAHNLTHPDLQVDAESYRD